MSESDFDFFKKKFFVELGNQIKCLDSFWFYPFKGNWANLFDARLRQNSVQ